jgi:hypothetical protein
VGEAIDPRFIRQNLSAILLVRYQFCGVSLCAVVMSVAATVAAKSLHNIRHRSKISSTFFALHPGHTPPFYFFSVHENTRAVKQNLLQNQRLNHDYGGFTLALAPQSSKSRVDFLMP